jgi:hypothetical protein
MDVGCLAKKNYTISHHHCRCNFSLFLSYFSVLFLFLSVLSFVSFHVETFYILCQTIGSHVGASVQQPSESGPMTMGRCQKKRDAEEKQQQTERGSIKPPNKRAGSTFPGAGNKKSCRSIQDTKQLVILVNNLLVLCLGLIYGPTY